MTKDLEVMTIEEIDAELLKRAAEMDVFRAKIKARVNELNAARNQKLLLAKLGDLSASDKHALAQALQAEGIESAEAVGNPGTR